MTPPSEHAIGVNIEEKRKRRRTSSSRAERIFPCSVAAEVFSKARNVKRWKDWRSLHHENVIDCDDIDVVDTFILKLLVSLEIAWDLASASSCEGSGDAHL